MKPDSSRLFAIDAAAILAVSVAICLASQRLLFMTIFVPLVLLVRIAAMAHMGEREDASIKAELLFLLICTVLGAFNDWNSVCNKQIYRYTVPHWFDFSTIPLWMLLFWGMILRFIARLARWRTLGPPEQASDLVGIGKWRMENAWVKIALELALVLATRQAVYRFHSHPVLSWLPFLIALALVLVLFHPTRHDAKLLAIFAAGGPLIEIAYIRIGELHAYALGWIGGVPLWIALWWLVAALIWKDLAFRIERALRGLFP